MYCNNSHDILICWVVVSVLVNYVIHINTEDSIQLLPFPFIACLEYIQTPRGRVPWKTMVAAALLYLGPLWDQDLLITINHGSFEGLLLVKFS